jgi:hypothetical protein
MLSVSNNVVAMIAPAAVVKFRLMLLLSFEVNFLDRGSQMVHASKDIKPCSRAGKALSIKENGLVPPVSFDSYSAFRLSRKTGYHVSLPQPADSRLWGTATVFKS